MRPSPLAFAIVALALFKCPTHAQAVATAHAEGGTAIDVCSVLQMIEPGDRIFVTVAGIYSQGYEHRIFYDGNQPLCDGEVQPSTWVEFATGKTAAGELEEILRRSRRASVVFRGEIFGPALLGPDDSTLPVNVAYANRIADRRYGHLSSFRTKLVVSEVVEAKPVPDATPWGGVWHKPPAATEVLTVKQAAMPKYPALARRAGLEGIVLVEVTVENGEVVATSVVAGDRLLSASAVSDIETWKFAEELQARFITTFSYQLRTRAVDASDSQVVAELPRRVTVMASADNW